MARKPSDRQWIVSALAAWKDKSLKEIAAAAKMPYWRLSEFRRRGEIPRRDFERLVGAAGAEPAEVAETASCYDGLEAVSAAADLTPAERAEIAETVRRASAALRTFLAEVARRSRAEPEPRSYPAPHEVEPARRRAAELLERLKTLPENLRTTVVQVAPEYQSWALCERVCDESERAASRNLDEASALALLAREIAEHAPGDGSWRRRLRGYAEAHAANALRVAGELEAADAALERATRLWRAGTDPAGLLDPGRLPDLEGSLRRAQRRFDAALTCLEEARAVSRCPGRVLIKKAFTLEVMGEYERAVATLLEAEPLVEGEGDPRLRDLLRLNLAINFTHLGRHAEAVRLVSEARLRAVELGDEINLIRILWVEGRIASGLGRHMEARALLAQARRSFAAKAMSYDVALALLEEAALLLEAGQPAEVKVLARELAAVFKSKGVHREARAALALFREAAEREAATAELARHVLGFLFRARHDPGLRFTNS
jgi:hypothetical protein